MFEESKIGKTDIQPPLTTMTGEVYQPARIYYQVSQKNAVLGRFKRLGAQRFVGQGPRGPGAPAGAGPKGSTVQ